MGELLESGAVAGFEMETPNAGETLASLLLAAGGDAPTPTPGTAPVPVGVVPVCTGEVVDDDCLLRLMVVRGASGGGSRANCTLRDSTTSFDCCRGTAAERLAGCDCCRADTAVVVLLAFSFALL